MSAETPPHLGGHFGITNTDQLALDYLVSRYLVRSLLDVGCGPGGMLDLALLRGIAALGIDGDPGVARHGTILHDFTAGPIGVRFLKGAWHVATQDDPEAYNRAALARPSVDLVWCVELAEHIEEQYLTNLLDTLRCGRVMLFTHALPGQGGHHHVNEQPPDYWRGLLLLDGWRLAQADTGWIQKHAGNQYIRRTGTVWTRS